MIAPPPPTAEPSPATGRHRMTHLERHEQLLDVAERLFVTQGYAAVTVEDIARAAGVSRPVIYNHYESREGLFLACVRRARQDYDAELVTVVSPDDPPETQLRNGAEAFFSMLERDPGRWLLLFGSNAVLPGTHVAELSELRFGTIEAVHQLLRRAAPDAPARRIEASAHAASGVGERLGHWWLRTPELTREELVEHFTEILWAGLVPYMGDAGA